MPTITLLRHGQASFGAADYDELSDLGHQQAAVAADALARRGLRDPLVVCGGLRRQRDTAAAVVRRIGTEAAHEDVRWDEYDHIGMVAAHADAADGDLAHDPRAFQQVLDRALHDWVTADAPDGWGAFAGGARAAVADLAAGLDGRDAVVATSGGVIAAVVAGLLGAGADAVVALNRVVVNAGLTTLLVGRSGTSLSTFNDHAHLSGPAAALRTYR